MAMNGTSNVTLSSTLPQPHIPTTTIHNTFITAATISIENRSYYIYIAISVAIGFLIALGLYLIVIYAINKHKKEEIKNEEHELAQSEKGPSYKMDFEPFDTHSTLDISGLAELPSSDVTVPAYIPENGLFLNTTDTSELIKACKSSISITESTKTIEIPKFTIHEVSEDVHLKPVCVQIEGKCVECDDVNIGKIHENDGLFYCNDCWETHIDDVLYRKYSKKTSTSKHFLTPQIYGNYAQSAAGQCCKCGNKKMVQIKGKDGNIYCSVCYDKYMDYKRSIDTTGSSSMSYDFSTKGFIGDGK